MWKVSVIIPSFKRPDLLERAIKSVLDQTFQDFEIIVVDDNAPGDIKKQTRRIVESFNDGKLRYVSHERNKGNASARNTGIGLASGEYIAFLDDDDVFLPKKLEVHVSGLEKSDDVVVLTYAQHLGVDKRANYEVVSPLGKDAKSGYIYDYMLRRYFNKSILFQTWDAVIKARFVEGMLFDSGGVDDFVLRLAKKGQFIFIPEILHIQNLDAEGRISTAPLHNVSPLTMPDIIYRKHLNYIKEKGIMYDRPSRISMNFLVRGTRLIRMRKMKEGRQHILQALKVKPSLYALLVFMLSLFGKNLFVKALKVRQKLIGGLK